MSPQYENVPLVEYMKDVIENHPNLLVVDPLRWVKLFVWRPETISRITKSNLSLSSTGQTILFPPTFDCEQPFESERERMEYIQNKCSFPVLSKSHVACGSASSHAISIYPSPESLSQASPWNHAEPCILQSFIPHSSVIYKVYVMAERVYVETRKSIPSSISSASSSHSQNNSETTTPTDETQIQQAISFNTQEMPKSMDGLLPGVLASFCDDKEKEKHEEGPQANGIEKLDSDSSSAPSFSLSLSDATDLAQQLRSSLGVDLFGFDVIVDDRDGTVYIVDVNYFPSYNKMPHFKEYLSEYLHMRVKKHAERKYVTIVGYGSLLSKQSALWTCPTLQNFRFGSLSGYRRLFNLVSVSAIRGGRANWDTKEVAALTVEEATEEDKCDNNPMTVSLFDIPESELPFYYERENRYRFEHVPVHLLMDPCRNGPPTEQSCGKEQPYVICVSGTDEWYKTKRCRGSSIVFHENVGQYYDGSSLWRSDVFPEKKYLFFILDALSEVDPKLCENFQDTTLLADRKTTIREYVKSLSRE